MDSRYLITRTLFFLELFRMFVSQEQTNRLQTQAHPIHINTVIIMLHNDSMDFLVKSHLLFLNTLQPVHVGKLSLFLLCTQTLCLFKFSAVLFGSLLLFLLHGSYLVTGRLKFCL